MDALTTAVEADEPGVAGNTGSTAGNEAGESVASPLADPSLAEPALRVRWLGRVRYRDALALQRALHRGSGDHLLLLEHHHVVTVTRRTPAEHLLVDVQSLGADLVQADRGGDVTYHGPGQLVGYPILDVATKRGGGMADTAAYVHGVEQVLIDVLAELGLSAGRLRGYAGVWLGTDDAATGTAGGIGGAGSGCAGAVGAGSAGAGAGLRKIAAVGVRLTRGRSMHGFALNVEPDLAWFDRIVACGIADKGVTSLRAEGVDATMREVVDLVAERAARQWGRGRPVDRADVAWRVRPEDLAAFTRSAVAGSDGSGLSDRADDSVGADSGSYADGDAGAASAADGAGPSGQLDAALSPIADGASLRLLGRLAEAGVAGEALRLRERKPEWMRVRLDHGPQFRRVRSTMRSLALTTVCEEAGCPNISECWNDGTATFMILGERCTRACGFCLVDTRKPAPADPGEPARLAEAVAQMGLSHAVITMPARDDLADGGADAIAATIEAVRRRNPGTAVEMLVSDLGGDEAALGTVFSARPDVFSHNIETVARLQRAVRPSAGYARSLAVLARAKAAGLVAKSSIVVGMGETVSEVDQTLADLAAVGADIVTVGQYLRPSARHLPVARWWAPEEFERAKAVGEALGIAHVEASPLTRSSYHARSAAEAAAG